MPAAITPSPTSHPIGFMPPPPFDHRQGATTMCPSTSLPAPHASTKCFLRSLAGAAAATLLLCGTAHAAGSGMPWEQPLEQVLLSVQGPVARIVAVIIIIITGLTLAFGEIGRASCRERVCQCVEISVVAVSLKKK